MYGSTPNSEINNNLIMAFNVNDAQYWSTMMRLDNGAVKALNDICILHIIPSIIGFQTNPLIEIYPIQSLQNTQIIFMD